MKSRFVSRRFRAPAGSCRPRSDRRWHERAHGRRSSRARPLDPLLTAAAPAQALSPGSVRQTLKTVPPSRCRVWPRAAAPSRCAPRWLHPQHKRSRSWSRSQTRNHDPNSPARKGGGYRDKLDQSSAMSGPKTKLEVSPDNNRSGDVQKTAGSTFGGVQVPHSVDSAHENAGMPSNGKRS